MATYYVDFVNGLDANNGLGPDASAGTNKPWKTIAKLLGAAGMASGDTAYLSPAGPFREVVTVAMTSAVAETFIIGDYANAQGFKTSGGVAVAPGRVIWTAYTTNDKTAAAATATLDLAGRDFLTFTNIMIVGGSTTTACVLATTSVSTNINFTDCCFYSVATASRMINVTSAYATALTWTIDRCYFFGSGQHVWVSLTRGGVDDYDSVFLIKNSLFLAFGTARCLSVNSTGAGTKFGGGVIARNCTYIGPTSFMRTEDANLSSTFPCGVYNCTIFTNSAITPLQANVLGQLVENYNLITCVIALVNVTAGANSISGGSYATMLHFGQERIWGGMIRQFAEPMAGSPLLGFGNDGTQSAYDLRNNPRPAGGNGDPDPAAGALERGDTWGRETSTVRTGSNALSITGPGYQDFLLPVDATLTTVTCYLRQDTTYAGTSPKLIALANAEIGVTEQTDTLAVADDTWEQLSVSFTPTAKGIITIRLLSSDTNGGGQAFADDFGVA